MYSLKIAQWAMLIDQIDIVLVTSDNLQSSVRLQLSLKGSLYALRGETQGSLSTLIPHMLLRGYIPAQIHVTLHEAELFQT